MRKKNNMLIFKVILLVFTFVCCSLIYFGFVLFRSKNLYNRESRWIGSVYEYHDEYVSFPKPFSLAYHSLRHGEKVPVLFDHRGFRIPVEQSSPADSTTKKLLFIGSSFTHGYGLPEEKTFAHLAATNLGMECMNAGISGWGLAQMVMRARQEIPKHRPDYVIVEYSDWILERSMQFYGPSTYGLLPKPFFYKSEGHIKIHPQVFDTKSFFLPIEIYTKKHFLLFAWNVGLPLYLHDDYHVIATWIKEKIGILPSPTQDLQAVIDFSYNEIDEICNQNDAKMFILKLYREPIQYTEQLTGSYHIIDTFSCLADALPELTPKNWSRQYHFWRGKPPRPVDSHLNKKASILVAKEISDYIKQVTMPSSNK